MHFCFDEMEKIVCVFSIYVIGVIRDFQIHVNCEEPSDNELYFASLPYILENMTEIITGNSIFSRKDDVRFFLFTRHSLNDYQELKSGDIASVKNSMFNFSKPTKIAVHGWLASGSTDFSAAIKNGFLRVYDLNMITVDWPSKTLYITARLRVNSVAKIVADFLDFLLDDVGVNKTSVQLVGHSLGAHIAGIAGKKIKNAPLPWITGFDPAATFFGSNKNERLDSSDADFVEVIHSCGKFLGFYDPIGHIDFYPNGGIPIQPGCGIDLGPCSHRRSYEYYIESMSEESIFSAASCNSYTDFINGRCCSRIIEMGPKVNKTTRGSFYFVTEEQSPFALGERGIPESCRNRTRGYSNK